MTTQFAIEAKLNGQWWARSIAGSAQAAFKWARDWAKSTGEGARVVRVSGALLERAEAQVERIEDWNSDFY